MTTSTDFMSRGVRCSGDLYLPPDAKNPPVVIMAHGFSFERKFGLPAFAERFVQQGLAVYLFDYRCFGGSDGEPRNLVDARRHVQDWQAALAHVRSLPQVDGDRIALWGTSFSGGHAIVAAAGDPSVAAIVIQVPFVDSLTTVRMLGLRFVLQGCVHAVRDLLRIVTCRPPYYVKALGNPDEFAIINTPGAMEEATALIPEDATWQNGCPARILLTILPYRPIAKASRVRCPALVMYAEHDRLISARSVEKAASRMSDSTSVIYPLGHFDLYTGSVFEDAVARQTKFLVQHLHE